MADCARPVRPVCQPLNIDWHRHPNVKSNGLLINILLAAAVCAIVASSFGSLVVMAEIMALCGAFLTGCASSGKLWFRAGPSGTILLAIACLLLWQRYGTLDLGLLESVRRLPIGSDIWVLCVMGFGLLAGIIPLHGCVPQAHANASAPAAALFSTVVMKVGLLGILTVSLLGDVQPLWWGIALLVLGMITAFVGGLYALMEHNIQRLLAYHTLENIGIILLGLGVGVTALALQEPVMVALGLTGGLYHLLNHSLFKTTLFLGAAPSGSLPATATSRSWAVLVTFMPMISLAMLVGPDGDGCAAAAERLCWRMVYLPVLLQAEHQWGVYWSSAGAVAGRWPGDHRRTGGECMAKVYGVTFLGAPRTKEAENACCAPLLMAISTVVMSAAVHRWRRCRAVAAADAERRRAAADGYRAHRGVSQPMITLLLIACPLLPFIILALLKGNRLPSRSRGAAWVCGYDHEQSMVITAHGFAMPVKQAFAPVLKLRKWLNPVSLVPGWQNAAAPLLLQRLALVELAVLVVIVISRGA
ncbi:proton-conducting transporter membrane subunit [Escherichia coli]